MHISTHDRPALRRLLIVAGASFSLFACTSQGTPEVEAPTTALQEGSAELAEPDHPMPTPAGLPGPAVLSARFKVTEAIVAARNTSIDSSSPSEPAQVPVLDAPPLTPLTLVFATNIHGELLDCGCPHHPLGGLARRATIWDGYAEHPEGTLHFDAGNALHKFPPRLGEAGAPSESDTLRAAAIMESLAAMDNGFLAIGPRDLPWGSDQLMSWSREFDLPLLNANIRTGGRPIGVPELVLTTSAGQRVGFTSVMREESLFEELWRTLDLTYTDAVGAASESIGRLRAQDVALVVLIDASGGGGLDTLVRGLLDAHAGPDVIIAAGDGRTTYEPRYINGVPMVEAGSRGKYIGAITLGLTAPPVRFATAGTERLESLESLRNLARVLGQAELRAARMDLHSDNARMAERTSELLLRQKIEYERALSTWQRVRLEPVAESGSVSELAIELVPVELELEERADVQAIVERANLRAATARSTP